jgi:hypothetical protein
MERTKYPLALPVHSFQGKELTICHDLPELPWPEGVGPDNEDLMDYLGVDWIRNNMYEVADATEPYYPLEWGRITWIRIGWKYNAIMQRILARARKLGDPDMNRIIAYYDELWP